jgi:hypothetical protein
MAKECTAIHVPWDSEDSPLPSTSPLASTRLASLSKKVLMAFSRFSGVVCKLGAWQERRAETLSGM